MRVLVVSYKFSEANGEALKGGLEAIWGDDHGIKVTYRQTCGMAGGRNVNPEDWDLLVFEPGSAARLGAKENISDEEFLRPFIARGAAAVILYGGTSLADEEISGRASLGKAEAQRLAEKGKNAFMALNLSGMRHPRNASIMLDRINLWRQKRVATRMRAAGVSRLHPVRSVVSKLIPGGASIHRLAANTP